MITIYLPRYVLMGYKKGNITWLFPNKKQTNTSAVIDGVIIGKCLKTNSDEKYYHLKMPTISIKTYFNIAEVIVAKKNNCLSIQNSSNTTGEKYDNHSRYKFLKFTKKNIITKSCMKKIMKIAISVCPRCRYSNCFLCCKKDKYSNTSFISKIISCFKCNNTFKTKNIDFNNYQFNKMKFYNILGYQNKKCMIVYQSFYKEFLQHLKNQFQEQKQKVHKSNDNLSHPSSLLQTSNKIKWLYNSLSEESKKELNYEPDVLNYSIKVTIQDDNNTKEKIIPPLIFFSEMNKTISFFKKLIDPNVDIKNIKTKYGSVISRGGGGKNNIFRTICCNRRYVRSARLVIVPRSQLDAHECILPYNIYCRLGCPKYVLCHRYPTLDLRSMTFHIVKTTWQYSCMGISTSIVEGNNADFDGDCLHVIPSMTLLSQSELIHLFHPKYNIISQQKLRVHFDHDERQTLFSLFGLNSTEIHNGLYAMALKEGSLKTYDLFCKFKRLCHFIWQYKSITTISCRDFLSIINQDSSYLTFINKIYPEIPIHNSIKEMIESHASRFSIDHLWQLFGEIFQDCPMGFLSGMNKRAFIDIAINTRKNLISEISLYGYTIIKLTHCTKSIYVGYDNRIYTTDGLLVALNVNDLL